MAAGVVNAAARSHALRIVSGGVGEMAGARGRDAGQGAAGPGFCPTPEAAAARGSPKAKAGFARFGART
jgi:hypothetical protein